MLSNDLASWQSGLCFGRQQLRESEFFKLERRPWEIDGSHAVGLEHEIIGLESVQL